MYSQDVKMIWYILFIAVTSINLTETRADSEFTQ